MVEVTVTVFVPVVQFRLHFKPRSPAAVAGTLSRQPLSGQTGLRDIQILSSHVRPGLTRHAKLWNSRTVDRVDMGCLQFLKDHGRYGSQADNVLLLPGILRQRLLW
jgi:hypothetical protein